MAMEMKDYEKVATLKRSITYMEMGEYAKSLTDLESLIQNDTQNSELFYFRG